MGADRGQHPSPSYGCNSSQRSVEYYGAEYHQWWLHTGTGGNTSTATSVTGTVTAGSSGIICYSNAVTMSNVTLGGANPTVLVFENGVTLGGTINSGTGALRWMCWAAPLT